MDRRTWTWLVLLAVLPACASIRVVPATRSESLFASLKDNLIGERTPAPRTLQTLRKYDLERLYTGGDVLETEERLLAQYKVEPAPDILYALAEIAFLAGRKAERHKHEASIIAYYRAAGYSYHYLFAIAKPTETTSGHPEPGWFTPQDSFDPRFRLACELYNQSLGKCLKAATESHHLDPRHVLNLPMPDGGTFKLSVKQIGFVWQPEDFNDLQLCSDFKVEGLANHHRTYGLGVPLIGTRYGTNEDRNSFLPKQLSFPVTAFFRFDGSLDELTKCRCGRLELYDPLRIQAIEVRGLRVPLESDMTTPMAYNLSRSELKGDWLDGFLRPAKVEEQTGIYMLEPYNPSKIPVIFVHGLLSSPLTWAPMFNDLTAELDLRSRYQFWFYFYPTASPYLVSAADLRWRLASLRRQVDPEGTDPNFGRMVLVGHSMGGLVSKLQTVDSGEAFWELTGEKPLDDLSLSAETKDVLREVMYFQANPAIAKVVFLGTPHRGSGLSTSTLGRLGSRLAGMPRQVVSASREVFSSGLAKDWQRSTAGIPNSVDMLRPGSPALEALLKLPRPAATTYHSIIGVTSPYDLAVSRLATGQAGVVGDAIVPFDSAHLEGVASEITVAANPNAHGRRWRKRHVRSTADWRRCSSLLSRRWASV